MKYLGRWEEAPLSFLPFIKHTTDADEPYLTLLGYKYAGNIADEEVQKTMSWIKKPDNLLMVYNTIKSVGLEKIISKERYNQKIRTLGDWDGKTLNEVINGYLFSDTTSSWNEKYYDEFWVRRKAEGNHLLVFTILKEVDEFYNEGFSMGGDPINDTLKVLLDFNMMCLNPADKAGEQNVYDYFQYLKKIGLQHSAYELAWYYEGYQPDGEWEIDSDSLIETLQLDTISEEEWRRTNINHAGWIDYQSIYSGP